MPGHLDAPAPSPQSLFTTPPKSWNPSPGVNFTHWGQPQAVGTSGFRTVQITSTSLIGVCMSVCPFARLLYVCLSACLR